MKYNRSEIMKAAWALYRDSQEDIFVIFPISFSEALKRAWAKAKRLANITDPEGTLFLLKMQDRWTSEDYALVRELERRIAAA